MLYHLQYAAALKTHLFPQVTPSMDHYPPNYLGLFSD